MFEFHGDRKRYFDIQYENAKKYVIPFIEVKKTISPGCRVLEIGCGEAGVLKAFIERGCIGVGVELEAIRLEMARQWLQPELESGKLTFYTSDIYQINPEKDFNGPFDIIILKDVIEHIHDQPKLINWMKGFLKEDGVIFFGFPPWQMPFGGHQQVMKSKFLSRLPYFHLLPNVLYKMILKGFGENVPEYMEIKETRISIEKFERISKKLNYLILHKTHFLFNPIYEYKFGWKPRIQNKLVSSIPFFRNFLTTCVYYLITPKK